MRLKNAIHANTYIRGYPMPTLYIADAERDADMKNLSRKEAAKVLEDMKSKGEIPKAAVTQWKRNTALDMAIEALKYSEVSNSSDCISRQAAIDALKQMRKDGNLIPWEGKKVFEAIRNLPSAQPERVWHPVEKPPAHHKDVIVRGVEAIGNVTVHKVMQWDVDTWRPTDYAPSIMWTEWSEI